ncbi:MAG: hypothetical protein NVSMB62_13710 [Acidobacteriaceae bacterium]
MSARIRLTLSFAAVLAFTTLSAAAQEAGLWHAASQTARAITGDIGLSAAKLTINFLTFTIARIRTLEPAEINGAFNPDPGTQGSGTLYRLNVPASTKLLRKNTLCGTDDTSWMATWVTGRTLEIAFFSGQKPPVFTAEAVANSADLCGTYLYTR